MFRGKKHAYKACKYFPLKLTVNSLTASSNQMSPNLHCSRSDVMHNVRTLKKVEKWSKPWPNNSAPCQPFCTSEVHSPSPVWLQSADREELEASTATFWDRLGGFCIHRRPTISTKENIGVFLCLENIFVFKEMAGEAAVITGASLCVYCSLFEWKKSAGYVLFHIVREYHHFLFQICHACLTLYFEFINYQDLVRWYFF